MVTISTVFLILSAIAFYLGGFSVPVPRVNWLCFGFAFWVTAILFGGHVLVP